MTGRAYGFFFCAAPLEKIEAEIPTIRSFVQTPSELELSLTHTANMQREGLGEILRTALDMHLPYAMEAVYGSSNRDAADELIMIINIAYNSPLYEEGEEFRPGCA